MSDFEQAVEYVLDNEGGLSENPNDAGGITNFGISLRSLKTFYEANPKEYPFLSDLINEETIRNLTVEQAKIIYKNEFWNYAAFDNIFDQKTCNYIFDMAVNMGISPAIKCAQRATWAMLTANRDVILEDGILGKRTFTAINFCGNQLLYPIRSERANFYKMLVEKNHANQVFLEGWLNRTYR